MSVFVCVCVNLILIIALLLNCVIVCFMSGRRHLLPRTHTGVTYNSEKPKKKLVER